MNQLYFLLILTLTSSSIFSDAHDQNANNTTTESWIPWNLFNFLPTNTNQNEQEKNTEEKEANNTTLENELPAHSENETSVHVNNSDAANDVEAKEKQEKEMLETLTKLEEETTLLTNRIEDPSLVMQFERFLQHHDNLCNYDIKVLNELGNKYWEIYQKELSKINASYTQEQEAHQEIIKDFDLSKKLEQEKVFNNTTAVKFLKEAQALEQEYKNKKEIFDTYKTRFDTINTQYQKTFHTAAISAIEQEDQFIQKEADIYTNMPIDKAIHHQSYQLQTNPAFQGIFSWNVIQTFKNLWYGSTPAFFIHYNEKKVDQWLENGKVNPSIKPHLAQISGLVLEFFSRLNLKENTPIIIGKKECITSKNKLLCRQIQQNLQQSTASLGDEKNNKIVKSLEHVKPTNIE